MIHLLYHEAQQPAVWCGRLSLKLNSQHDMSEDRAKNDGASWSVNLVPLPTTDYLNSRLLYYPTTGSMLWKDGNRKGKEAGCKQYRSDGSPNAIRIGFADSEGTLIQYVAHRLIFAMKSVLVPFGMVIDHWDGDPFNNKWDNLRIASHPQNLVNQKHRDRELPHGVYLTASGRYLACFSHHRKTINVGTFDTAAEARASYEAKRIQVYGDFAIH